MVVVLEGHTVAPNSLCQAVLIFMVKCLDTVSTQRPSAFSRHHQNIVFINSESAHQLLDLDRVVHCFHGAQVDSTGFFFVCFVFNEETRDVIRFCHRMRKFTHFQVHWTITMHKWGFTLNEFKYSNFAHSILYSRNLLSTC